ncbi:Hypothetical protein R9X50_00675300 [Acrodontium crateriforme]|uniref:DUF7580 domain-containing protein n=1 Tax=Acrodontium crateriforme TaxID=150365 RepID=A0AAQ3RCB8_9PEZI|nr:Hypothetical protein R9X50_00675300 [Acrodontium crateriforme]
MSGIEVVGLLLGVFPLCISAMEHYEQEKRVLGTFWRIRKSHRKDLGKLKDCQLKFKLNMKELLLPLLLDDVIDRVEYEQLLADPGGPGWKDESVDEALANRLSESHQRYLEILDEFSETMMKLTKAVKVDDPEFQSLISKDQAALNPKTDAQKLLMTRANFKFQAKRVKYSFSGATRDILLDQIEKYNGTLESLLATNDRVSALAQITSKAAPRSMASKIVQYWRHADRIFTLMTEAFKCHCKSMHYANLWLSHRPAGTVDMSMVLKFSQGIVSIDKQPWKERPLQIKLAGKASQSSQGAICTLASSKANLLSMNSTLLSASTITKSVNLTSPSVSSITLNMSSVVSNSTLSNLKHKGLCQSVCGHNEDGSCIGCLIDDDNDANYTVLLTTTLPDASTSITLADALTSRPPMSRAQRYAIALTLASSHLQLHSTPWLSQEWRIQDVHLPVSLSPTRKVLYNEPYLQTVFESQPSLTKQKDMSFATLGICLLELCFGMLLEEHHLWEQPCFAQGKNNPIIRQAVASEWLEEVAGEAGPEYAAALEWTLRSAPAVAGCGSSGKWRADFASMVIQPLQRCYEFMRPT